MIDYKHIADKNKKRDEQLQAKLWELSRDFLAGSFVVVMFGYIIAGFVS